MLKILIILGALIYGGFQAMVRDQDWIGPNKPANAGGNPFKEIGKGTIGLPFGFLIAWSFGWTIESIVAGIGAAALTSFAWSLRHAVTSYITGRPDRALEADTFEALLNLAIGGALVTLGPALALGWFGCYIAAGFAILAGAAKAGTYRLAWYFRPIPGKRPEATFFGHVFSGVIALGGGATAILLAAG